MPITKLTGFKTSDGNTYPRYADALKWETFLKFEKELQDVLRDELGAVPDLPRGVRGLAQRFYAKGFRHVPSSVKKKTEDK